MRLFELLLIVFSAMLLGGGLTLLCWAQSIPEGTALWGRTMSTGSLLAVFAALVGAVGTIIITGRRRRG
jgi:hypothetical protein